MSLYFAHKHFMTRPAGKVVYSISKTADKVVSKNEEEKPSEKKAKNKKVKKSSDMITNEQIEAAEAIVMDMAPEVKVVKKDRGLIERTESSKIILTEDNRQVLND